MTDAPLTIAAWLHTPLAQAIGWALLHFIWEGAALALLLAAWLCLVRPASARRRYGAACVVLLAMPLAFAITLALELPDPQPAPAKVVHLSLATARPALLAGRRPPGRRTGPHSLVGPPRLAGPRLDVGRSALLSPQPRRLVRCPSIA